ncbi:MAG TPA: YraN family protein [Bryobacteraceae bacterium]|nr:YraN family protein [Bryobacteraceae bacterium]
MAPLYKFADHLRHRRHADVGRRGEDLAHRYLRKNGFIVAARNWRPPQGGGELDLVAWEGHKVVFVEVKSRQAGATSAPERDIDPEKIQALRRAARDYLRRSGADPNQTRFDVITVTGTAIAHLRDAFPL